MLNPIANPFFIYLIDGVLVAANTPGQALDLVGTLNINCPPKNRSINVRLIHPADQLTCIYEDVTIDEAHSILTTLYIKHNHQIAFFMQDKQIVCRMPAYEKAYRMLFNGAELPFIVPDNDQYSQLSFCR